MSYSAALAQIPVGVVVERRKATSAWIDYVWHPVLVLAGQPDTAPWTPLAVSDETTTFYAGSADVGLHRADTTYYRDNLATGAPLLWVALRPTGVEPPYDILMVTASPAEGEALTETGTDLVETVPMPDLVRDAVAAFVAEHHVEQVFFKRKRDSATMPERRAPGSAPRAPTREDEP